MMKKAIIKRVAGGHFQAFYQEQIIVLHSPGKIKKEFNLLVGDEVIFEEDGDDLIIKEVCERRNSFIRPKAANIDVLLIVQSIKEPDFDRFLVDKLTVYAAMSKARPIILFTKSDLSPSKANKLVDEYNRIGIKTFIGRLDNNNYDELLSEFSGQTILLVGNSGVGKSTFLNNITGSDIQSTNEISQKLGRGKHTTRHVELFQVQDFRILDTPGFSSLEIPALHEQVMLANYFIEFDKYSGACKFKTCAHINEPSCMVKKAVEDGNIIRDRYQSYVRLYNLLKEKREW